MEKIIELKEWAKKVSLNKRGLDKKMFDGLFDIVLSKLTHEGYDKTIVYLKNNYDKGINHPLMGPVLLAQESKLIKDKLWSLNAKNI